MRKEMQPLIIIGIVIICIISVAGYMYYTEMQHKNEELNQMINDLNGELEDLKNQSNNTTEENTTEKSSSTRSSGSTGNHNNKVSNPTPNNTTQDTTKNRTSPTKPEPPFPEPPYPEGWPFS